MNTQVARLTWLVTLVVVFGGSFRYRRRRYSPAALTSQSRTRPAGGFLV